MRRIGYAWITPLIWNRQKASARPIGLAGAFFVSFAYARDGDVVICSRPKARMLVLVLAALLFAVALGLPSGALAAEFRGRVVGVADGDTISVMRAGYAVRVRLHGIDAPEKGQAFSNRAKHFVSELVFGKEVTVRDRGLDRYGRTIGEVFLLDGRNVNHEIVRAGLAWWFRRYATGDRKLEKLEESARKARRGLWVDRYPVPPWEWRRGLRSAGSR
jgi:micrococcal nuclease